MVYNIINIIHEIITKFELSLTISTGCNTTTTTTKNNNNISVSTPLTVLSIYFNGRLKAYICLTSCNLRVLLRALGCVGQFYGLPCRRFSKIRLIIIVTY